MEPRVIERTSGGWLAVTAPGDSPRIGVTAPSQTEVKAAFADEAQAWEALLDAAHQAGYGVERTED
jgi:hypothetical protein